MSVQSYLILAVSFLSLVPMAIEAGIAGRNEAAQRWRGGVEPPGDVYEVMRVAYPGAFLAMLLEGWLRGGPSLIVFVVGFAVFLDAKTLKWWAIRTLGQAWTFRVIVVPGVPLVAAGPYKLMRHPNYLAVVGEFIGLALMTGAWISGPLMTVLFGALIFKRLQVEERALAASAGPTYEAHQR